ncbi:hypothetical protein Fcan01_16073 [Folsomia candida]|uniref:Uncharacterized protein n=1 Tax=Folsomia candida TaxID=158441 RepID=A0A226DVL0_FOLCA|nr:hypothetical protein Fcan01_16073 [Folsomia candida]
MEPNTSTGHHDDQISRGDGNASQTDDGFSSVGDNDADGDVQSVRKSRNSHPSEWITDSKARGNKASKAKKAIADKAKEVAKTCGSRIVVIHENSLLVDTYEGGADLPGQPPGRTIRKRPPFELPEQVREKIRTQNPDEDLTSKNQSLTVTSASPPMSPISYSPPSEPGPSNHVTIFSTKYLTPSKPPTSAVNSGNDYSPSKRPIPSSLPFTQADAIIANSKICQLCKLSSSPRHIRNAKDNWMGCEFAACQYWIHLSCSGFVFSKNQHLDATKFYCGEHYPKSGSRKRN